MEKKKWFNVSVTSNRGSTTISHTLKKPATSKSEAIKLAKECYKQIHPNAKNVTTKKK